MKQNITLNQWKEINEEQKIKFIYDVKTTKEVLEK